MASLTDLFNPTFFMFLGILLLVVALLVVYYEGKMREQNHKIASMLSLVSTLADDMNGVKMGLNHLVIRGGQGFSQPIHENLGIVQPIQNPLRDLIEVSDDEKSEEEDEDQTDDEEDQTDDEDENIKVIKLQVSKEDEDDENNTVYYDEIEDLAESDLNDELPEITDDYVEQVLDLKYSNDEISKIDEVKEHLEESNINLSTELKTISINLGQEKQPLEESIEYKKLQLSKLRSIAVEKGLTSSSEVSKLKKPEILKLLGAE